jgi:predicted HicB family RNase H-like nuclease
MGKITLLVWILFTCQVAVNATAPSVLAEETIQRQKVIDFEDEVVEGVNKRPLDSVSQLSEKDRRRKKPHLYRKRASFKSETSQTLTEIRYQQ